MEKHSFRLWIFLGVIRSNRIRHIFWLLCLFLVVFLGIFDDEVGDCVHAKSDQAQSKGEVKHDVEVLYEYLWRVPIEGYSRTNWLRTLIVAVHIEAIDFFPIEDADE